MPAVDRDRSVMKSSGLCFTLLLSFAILDGCTLGLQTTLFNNTGQAVAVQERGYATAVERKGYVQFWYPGKQENGVFRLSSEECVYLYDLSGLPQDYHLPAIPLSSQRGIQLQVERDFSIDLLPSDYAGDA